jgi:uncharacterized membrane protein YebE (DUF533 family)
MGLNAQGLLNQLLSSGQPQRTHQSRTRGRAGRDDGVGDLLSQVGGSAVAGKALGMLLGKKRGRKLGASLLGRGGAAALGTLAYRAYSEWQAQQQRAAAEVRTLDRVSEGEAEAQSQAVLKAMVAAAKADGHIDDRERQAIEGEFGKLGDEPEVRGWLSAELRKPLDPAEVAAAADSEVVASEMYLASRLVVDTESFMERAYLDELARCLKLDKALQTKLDEEAERAA